MAQNVPQIVQFLASKIIILNRSYFYFFISNLSLIPIIYGIVKYKSFDLSYKIFFWMLFFGWFSEASSYFYGGEVKLNISNYLYEYLFFISHVAVFFLWINLKKLWTIFIVISSVYLSLILAEIYLLGIHTFRIHYTDFISESFLLVMGFYTF